MKRPLLIAALLLPLTSLLLTGCGGASSADTSGGSSSDGSGSVTLNVGDQKGGSEAILRAAGELDDLTYKIKWSTFTSGPPLLEAINAKAVDVGGVGNTPPVFAAGSGSKITVIGVSHGSSAGEAIVVPKDSPLKTPADLKGKSVAVAQGSSAHYQLVAALKKAGLSLSDVKVKLLQPADALAAFSRGKVDAWSIWDPYTSQVLRTPGTRVLTTGEGVTNGLSFQVAAPGALKDPEKSKALDDYLKRLERAQAWVFKHPEEWAKVWAKETGLPYEVALDSVKRTAGTRVPVALDDAAIASEQQIADTFAELKLIPKKFVFKDYVDTRFNGNRPPSSTPPLSYGKASS
ncbi:ABC transporter substrate-binding protein [Streptomyces spiroverticillatus]|uniref:Putative aliphatic sulfonates-binding protein n=1 Tax=Streptomyces finlayi TaxID=67296 RepID=A0A919CD45_9ACTN|nr:ABC transporter substrate-binding protein [Streptomyces finlayi]GHA29382.1 ABC transporter substrate-binding protein [Streptomyces spiroverticillatus]GHD09830.1 ABC transporter substrate-binding protein [Streptomyces finlayi]